MVSFLQNICAFSIQNAPLEVLHENISQVLLFFLLRFGAYFAVFQETVSRLLLFCNISVTLFSRGSRPCTKCFPGGQLRA